MHSGPRILPPPHPPANASRLSLPTELATTARISKAVILGTFSESPAKAIHQTGLSLWFAVRDPSCKRSGFPAEPQAERTG